MLSVSPHIYIGDDATISLPTVWLWCSGTKEQHPRMHTERKLGVRPEMPPGEVGPAPKRQTARTRHEYMVRPNAQAM